MEGEVNKIKFRGDILIFLEAKTPYNLFFLLNAIFEILFFLFYFFLKFPFHPLSFVIFQHWKETSREKKRKKNVLKEF
jgi:hypothetical protein